MLVVRDAGGDDEVELPEATDQKVGIGVLELLELPAEAREVGVELIAEGVVRKRGVQYRDLRRSKTLRLAEAEGQRQQANHHARASIRRSLTTVRDEPERRLLGVMGAEPLSAISHPSISRALIALNRSS